MAAELEGKLGLTSELIQGSGGIFEVEYKGAKVFSKKMLNRFPEDVEVPEIIRLMDQGIDLKEAQAKAAEGIPEPPSFMEWFGKFFKGDKEA